MSANQALFTQPAPAVEPVAVPGLWQAVGKLLRLRTVILLSGFRRAKLRRKIGLAVLAVLFLAFLGFIFFLSWTLLGFLKSPELAQVVGDVRPFVENFPSLVMSGAFLGILVTSFGVLLQALYLAGDMDFLLTTPLPIRAVFLTKLLQAILPNFSLICLFALPLLYGLGLAWNYNLLYFILVPLQLAALALAAAGISSLLVMGLVRIFPARRVAEVLGFVGATVSFLCSQSGNLMRFEHITPGQTDQALQLMKQANSGWSPLAWAGRGLVELGKGNWLLGSSLLVITLGGAALAFFVALTTAERLYYSGWASMQGVQKKKKVARQPQAAPALSQAAGLGASLAQRVPSVLRAIIYKDFLMLSRDLRNMSQLVTPLILGIVYAVMFVRGGSDVPAGRGEAPAIFMAVMQNLWVYGNVAISLFVVWVLLARLAGMGFSQEGKSYWMLKAAPVKSWQLLVSKFLVAFLPATLLGWAFLIVISLLKPGGPATLWFTLPVVALAVAGSTGISLVFGVLGANFNWEDPRRMQRGPAGCLGMIASVLYYGLTFALFFGPPLLAPLVQLPEFAGQIAGLVLGGIFSIVCALAPALVTKQVEALGEA